MSHNQFNNRVAAPCIVDTGIVVNKRDLQRLLVDLGRVRYIHIQDGIICSEGEGYVLEVFADPTRSTLIANHALYLNVYPFSDAQLELSTLPSLRDKEDVKEPGYCEHPPASWE
ncbi:hypothetical protein OSCI_3720016 [Kamptonema sp. PCC 6506]|nr:hypothetical protein OSCI_3720016 [Kamptonema sp. PCC 6506]